MTSTKNEPTCGDRLLIRFAVTGAPVAQGRPRFRVTGRFPHIYTDQKTKTHRELVSFHAKLAMQNRTPTLAPVRLHVQAYFPIPKSWSKTKQANAHLDQIAPCVKPDCDNIFKLVADSLNGIVYKDDCQVIAAFIVKRYSRVPTTLIEAWEVG